MSNEAQRNAVFQTDVTQYGEVPDLAQAAKALGLSSTDLTGILGPDIAKLAQENTAAGTSTVARLGADNTKAIGAIKNALAARGVFNSGETGYQLGQQQQAYMNAGYDALQKLFGGMDTAQQGYLTAEQQRLEAIAQVISDAANRAAGEYPPSPGSPAVPATTATWVGADTAGNPVYQDSGGNLYNPDGSSYSGPANAGAIGLGTGPYRPEPQTPAYSASHVLRFGF